MRSRRLNKAPNREEHGVGYDAAESIFLGKRMFTVLFDTRQKVMLTRYTGVLSSDDIAALDEYVRGFVAREGFYVRSIFDLTGVEVFAISRPKLLLRGRKLRINPGQDRVFVAPQHEIHELYRDYAQAQLDLGNGKMMVVERFDEALRLLGLHDPNFQPLTRRASLEV
jgi:hypothetical protein